MYVCLYTYLLVYLLIRYICDDYIVLYAYVCRDSEYVYVHLVLSVSLEKKAKKR